MTVKTIARYTLIFTTLVLLGLLGAFIYFEVNQENSKLSDEVRTAAPGKFVHLANGQVHFRLGGAETAEPLIFIHGGGITGAEVWENNIPFFLNHGYRVLAFDLYGRGYSDRPATRNSPELFLGQLVQLLDTLQINGPVNMVALSMGAIVALDFAHQYPHRVRKVVLIDPAASGNYKPNPLLTIPVVSDFLMTTYWYPRAVENQRKEFVDNDLFNTYSQRLQYFMDFEGYKRTNYSTWMNMLNQDKVDLVQHIPASSLLLIYGDKDPYFNDRQNERYRGIMPTLQVLKVENAGHMPNLEKPAVVNNAILQFLQKQPAGERYSTGAGE